MDTTDGSVRKRGQSHFSRLVIRPGGGVSLCCQDALGRHTLGDSSKEKLVDIWNGRPYGKKS